MRLVKNNDIWFGFQGEGIYVGTPSIFVRLWGCNTKCPWCDTKEAQDPENCYDAPLDAVVGAIGAFPAGVRNVVITGGDPCLQSVEVVDLIRTLHLYSLHITVETQASVLGIEIASVADLLSLSPKLHAWPSVLIEEYLRACMNAGHVAQFKLVCTKEHSAQEALERMADIYRWMYDPWRKRVFFVLQPEFSGGEEMLRQCEKHLTQWLRTLKSSGPKVRIVPQMHRYAGWR